MRAVSYLGGEPRRGETSGSIDEPALLGAEAARRVQAP